MGFSLGHFSPGYYRAVFSSGDLPTFDPIQVGLGLGITQGFVGGVIIGFFIVLTQGESSSLLRNTIKQFLNKYRRLLLVIVSVLAILFIFIYWQLRKLGDDLAAHAYTDYVSLEYMPTQRRLTRKWPTNLSKLPSYVKAEEENTGANELLNTVLRFHSNAFERFEPVHTDEKSYIYILHLKGYTVKCESVVNKSGFDDGNCTYEQK